MKREWIPKVTPTKYPDINKYAILEPNPDYNKSGVCYSGQHLGICVLDSFEDAKLICSAVNACIAINPENPQAVADTIKDMYEALLSVYSDIELQNVAGGSDELNIMVQQALAKADGK